MPVLIGMFVLKQNIAQGIFSLNKMYISIVEKVCLKRKKNEKHIS